MHRNERLIIFRSDQLVCRGAEVDVKKLPKRPAPPAFGRKLTEAQKASPALSSSSSSLYSISLLNSQVGKNIFQARATHICLDCGYIYTLQKPFDEQVRFLFSSVCRSI